MKIIIITLIAFYILAMAYLYLFQTSIVFNSSSIEKKESFVLANTSKISLHVEGAVLDGVYKKSQKSDAPLIIYFGGNADDATRILLHVKNLKEFDIVAFNYRGYVNSTGVPSEKKVYEDALEIYDKYSKNKEVIFIGRSLGTGVASYVASKIKVKGVVLITPYDSIASIAKRQYPIFPIDLLLKHKFESDKNVLHVKAPIGLIEVENDEVVTKYHFDKLKEKVPNLALHVELKDTTHGEVLTHPKFEKNLLNIIEKFEK